MPDSDFPTALYELAQNYTTALYGLAQNYEQELQKARTRIEQRENELLGHLRALTKIAEQLMTASEQCNNLKLRDIYAVHEHLSRMLEVEERKQFDRHYHV